VRLEASLTGEASAVATGGLATGVRALGDADFRLRLDLERLVGWPGASAQAYAFAGTGGDPSELAGDLQGVSNVVAPGGARLLEAWLQQNALDGRLSLLAGLSDLNSEFYVLQAAALFLDSSFGIGPELSQSGQGGPSIFPATSPGVRVELRPRPDDVLRLAVTNGVPLGFDRPGGGTRVIEPGDGALLVAEVAHLWGLVGAEGAPGDAPRSHRMRAGRAALDVPYSGKVALGAWRYTARFPVIGGEAVDPPRRGDQGIWLIGEAALLGDADRPPRRVQLFTQLALADPRFNRIARYTSLGATARGFLPGREDDELGLAVAVAWQGAPWRTAERAGGGRPVRAETVLEGTWVAVVAPWLSLQPDVQLVLHPGGEERPGHALWVALRAEVGL
jgi:porin